jgi:hypothetical protein
VLSLLGYQAPCAETIREYMVKPKMPRSPSTTWLPFLPNRPDCSRAMDFLTVTTLSFLVLDHARREVLHFAITPNPTMAWVIQHLREAMPFGQQPCYLLQDNDGTYGQGVRPFLISCGILEARAAYQSPWRNPYIERIIGTLRRELLHHVVVLNQRGDPGAPGAARQGRTHLGVGARRAPPSLLPRRCVVRREASISQPLRVGGRPSTAALCVPCDLAASANPAQHSRLVLPSTCTTNHRDRTEFLERTGAHPSGDAVVIATERAIAASTCLDLLFSSRLATGRVG